MVKKYSIAVDMDEVLCDLYWKWLQFYNAIFDEDIQIEDITDWNIGEFVKEEHQVYFLNILKTHKFFRNLRPKDHSQEVLKDLNEKYKVIVVTDPFSRMGYKAKHDWLFEHYPFLKREQLIFTSDKSNIYADYMIDDNINHINNFKGVGVLMDAPHNQKEVVKHRVFNWRHIKEAFINNCCQVCDKPLSSQFCSTDCEDKYMKEFT